MGEKEKANELIQKAINALIDSGARVGKQDIKAVCLFCIDEVISACEHNYVENWNTDWWNRVKDEINKL